MRHTKQMLRAEIVMNYSVVNLEKNFFELEMSELARLNQFKEIFNFRGKNNMGRSELRQFYYHLQKGYEELKKEA